MTRRTIVAALAALALVTVSTAGLVRATSATSPQDQCALPLSERVGGWFCPGSNPNP